MDILIIAKIIFLFFAVSYGFSNIVKVFRREVISGYQILTMAIGIVGFVVIQFKLYL